MSKTVSECPAFIKLMAMGRPIVPRPMKPTCLLMCYLLWRAELYHAGYAPTTRVASQAPDEGAANDRRELVLQGWPFPVQPSAAFDPVPVAQQR